MLNGAVTVSGQFVSDTLKSLGQCDAEEIKSVSAPSVLHEIWMLLQVREPRTHQCQRRSAFSVWACSPATLWHAQSVQHMCVCVCVCVCALRWVSLCVILCVIHLARSRPTAWHSYSVCVYVCVCVYEWLQNRPPVFTP